MLKYKATIGLEVHAELKTRTKMFCNSKNDPDEDRPNVNICPICMGHPGTLPVVNKEAVKSVLKVGLAVNGTLAKETKFDRKNYFYPDIPKGYQISQYDHPLVKGGSLNGVALTRIHLEEDTARSIHGADGKSLVDFNRAGVPLMELVTEPVITNAKQAGDFARELQLLLQYLGASEANMEKGEMRVEANISISDSDKFGTKVEVKNLNSFKSVEKAIAYELTRQEQLLEKGEKVMQETRGWDEKKEVTFSQRKKEDSHDYRYFPDPDIPVLDISKIPEFSLESLKSEIGELPHEKRDYYTNILGIKSEDAEMYVRNHDLRVFFDEVTKKIGNDKSSLQLASNYITSDIRGIGGKDVFEKIDVDNFSKLVGMINDGVISSRGAKNILALMLESNEDPGSIAKKENLFQQNDESSLKQVVQKIIESSPDVVNQYKNGKSASLQFLIGQAMKETRGSANPGRLKEIFEKELK